jgi:hypothetical protein
MAMNARMVGHSRSTNRVNPRLSRCQYNLQSSSKVNSRIAPGRNLVAKVSSRLWICAVLIVDLSHFPGWDVAAARSSSDTRASISSISMALAAWLKIASAARTRTDAGVAGSIIVFSSVVAAAEVAC